MRDKAWKQFCEYIKLRECFLKTGSHDRGFCYLCNLSIDFDSAYVGNIAVTNTNLYDENRSRILCYNCSAFGDSKSRKVFAEKLKEEGEVKQKPMGLGYKDLYDYYRKKAQDLFDEYQ